MAKSERGLFLLLLLMGVVLLLAVAVAVLHCHGGSVHFVVLVRNEVKFGVDAVQK